MSTVGKVLDPVADRVLLAVAAISIIAVGAVPLWVAVVALAWEVLVAGAEQLPVDGRQADRERVALVAGLLGRVVAAAGSVVAAQPGRVDRDVARVQVVDALDDLHPSGEVDHAAHHGAPASPRRRARGGGAIPCPH